MALPIQSRWPAAWDILYSQLVTETGPTGRISTVKAVTHHQYPSTTNQFPSVGVQFTKASWEIIGQRTRRETGQFAIVAFTIAAPTDDVADAIEAAVVALRPLVNDGNGNGLEPILNGIGAYLGGASIRTMLSDIEYDILPNPDQSAQAIAYARCMLDVVDQVASSG